jgi:hypothetical protein
MMLLADDGNFSVGYGLWEMVVGQLKTFQDFL